MIQVDAAHGVSLCGVKESQAYRISVFYHRLQTNLPDLCSAGKVGIICIEYILCTRHHKTHMSHFIESKSFNLPYKQNYEILIGDIQEGKIHTFPKVT